MAKNNNMKFWIIVIIIALIAGFVCAFLGNSITVNVIRQNNNPSGSYRIYQVSETYNRSELYTRDQVNAMLNSINAISCNKDNQCETVSIIASSLNGTGNSYACIDSNGKIVRSDYQCVCTPQCSGKQCGSNGCGGSCGTCPTGQICSSNGQCVSNNITCTDSDGGINYIVKGTVDYSDFYGSGRVTDLCINSVRLAEYSCNISSGYNYKYTEYNCPNTCSNGSCV